MAWDEPVAYIGLLLQCALYISYIGRPARSSKFLQQAVHPMVKPPRTQVTVQCSLFKQLVSLDCLTVEGHGRRG